MTELQGHLTKCPSNDPVPRESNSSKHMTRTGENQGSRKTYASRWQLNPFLVLPLREKKVCLNLASPKRGT